MVEIKKYSPIELTSNLTDKFNDFMMSQKSLVDYLSLTKQDKLTGNTYCVMSCPEWQKTYKENNFSEADPLRHESYYGTSPLIVFDEVACDTSFAYHVMEQRKRHYMEKGFSMVKRSPEKNCILTVASGYHNFSARKFCQKNQHELNQLLESLVKCVFE